MKSIASLTLIALLVCGTSIAATKKTVEKPWAQEPNSFMGLSFSSSIVNDIPKCTARYADDEKSLCYVDPPLSGYFLIRGTPSIGLAYASTLGVKVTEGAIEYFYLTTNVNDFPALTQVFISKYGNPSIRSVGKVKTRGGAEFDNETLVWKGKKVSITLQKFGDDINTSSATIQDDELTNRSAAIRESKAAAAASKL